MSMPIREYRIRLDIPEGGYRMASMALPNSPVARAGIVLLHGWGGPRSGPGRLLRRMATTLAENGFPAIRPDLAGRGESSGDPETIRLDDMIADAMLAARYLLQHADCRRLFCAGICSGANIAAGAAALWSTLTKESGATTSTSTAKANAPNDLSAPSALALVSMLAYQPPPRDRAARRRLIARLGEYARKAVSFRTWRRIFQGDINFRGVRETLAAAARAAAVEKDRDLKNSQWDIPAAWAASQIPALFVYGAADPEAPEGMRHYREFCSRAGLSAAFHLVNDADHNFGARPWQDELIHAVTHYFQSAEFAQES